MFSNDFLYFFGGISIEKDRNDKDFAYVSTKFYDHPEETGYPIRKTDSGASHLFIAGG